MLTSYPPLQVNNPADENILRGRQKRETEEGDTAIYRSYFFFRRFYFGHGTSRQLI